MILVRKGIQFEVLEKKNGYTKLIRVDDVEHRAKQKLEWQDNEFYKMFLPEVQQNILRELDKPQYLYVPEHWLKLFKKL